MSPYLSFLITNNNKTGKMDFKKRPVLVIGKADNCDYIVLPVSRITRSENIDSHYDLPMEVLDYPLMNLTAKSYIRTHKQTVLHKNELIKEITDFKKNYQCTYFESIRRVETFQKTLIERAI